MRTHKDGTLPASKEIFVFGSNQRGIHGAGAAEAALSLGAKYGIGEGISGSTYAIPTKDANLKTMSLQNIHRGIVGFIRHAGLNPNANFFVTRVGCGLAKLTDSQVAPLFGFALPNCSYATDWSEELLDLSLNTENPLLEILESTDSGYRQRTKHNADSADITVALAEDYTTAGERLTCKVAGGSYLQVPLTLDPTAAALRVYRRLKVSNLTEPTINIAGNGIYTLKPQGWTQELVNWYVYQVLSKVHQHWPLKRIVSGGQTGVDLAGTVAAAALKIHSVATLPRNFVQRDARGVDSPHSAQQILTRVCVGVSSVNYRKLQQATES